MLITGGTGSLGQALTRYLLDTQQPRRILIYSRDEWKQSVMADSFGDARLRFVLGDVRDRDRLQAVLPGVDVVIHAAALKRVDAIAYNPTEVVLTNVMGTTQVCLAAITAGVGLVVTISSDKAVHPSNMYGCTKQMAEHITTGCNVHGIPQRTRLASVRYGNVLGSRGSVVHRFREMSAAGMPLTITDPLMSRFWITLQQACDLILTTLRVMRGGEILLPKLPAAALAAIAEAVAPGHKWDITGLRPGGEKLHERLLSDEESSRTFDHGRYYLVAPSPHPWTATEWEGVMVPPGFTYASDTTEWTLGIPELRTLLKDIP